MRETHQLCNGNALLYTHSTNTFNSILSGFSLHRNRKAGTAAPAVLYFTITHFCRQGLLSISNNFRYSAQITVVIFVQNSLLRETEKSCMILTELRKTKLPKHPESGNRVSSVEDQDWETLQH